MTQMHTEVAPPVVVGGPFMPVPKPPSRLIRQGGLSAAEVAAVVGLELSSPVARAEEAAQAAEEACSDLERHRPGGRDWRDAADADGADVVEGVAPKQWRLARMLDSDPARWAAAHATVRAARLVQRRTQQELDRAAIVSKAELVADTRAIGWAKEALEGWEARADRAVAYSHLRAGEEQLAGYRAAAAVVEWAGGTLGDGAVINVGGQHVTAARPAVDVTGFSDLPQGRPEAAGCWLALGLVLEPSTVWTSFPPGVVWPEGSKELIDRAIPEGGDRLRNLRERGVHEVRR